MEDHYYYANSSFKENIAHHPNLDHDYSRAHYYYEPNLSTAAEAIGNKVQQFPAIQVQQPQPVSKAKPAAIKKKKEKKAPKEPEIQKIECQYCHQEFPDTDSLFFHRSAVHNLKRSIYSCPICQKVLTTSNSLKCHVLAVHEKKKSHICSFCQASFASRSGLRDHVMTKHEVQQFKCPFCGLGFNLRRLFSKHIILKHGGQCNSCSEAFADVASLSKHMVGRGCQGPSEDPLKSPVVIKQEKNDTSFDDKGGCIEIRDAYALSLHVDPISR